MRGRKPQILMAVLVTVCAIVAAGPAAGADTRPQSRIVGGTTTTISEWPWQVALTLNKGLFINPLDAFDRQICGGALIAPDLAITAAHCTDYLDDPDGRPDLPALFGVVTGRTTLSDDSQGEEHAVEGIFYFTQGSSGPEIDDTGNPLYDPDTNQWDAVLIDFAGPAAPGAAPIKIAGADEGLTWVAGRPAAVTGWGATRQNGPSSDTLREVAIQMLSDETCANYEHPTFGPYPWDPVTQVCAGWLAGGRDTCQGDSGGPMVVPTLSSGFRLVGDTSFGIGCARRFKPGVYGRIADEPLRSILQNAALAAAGVDIVGSGAQPGPQTSPETTIVSGPKNKTKKKSVRFEFVSSKDGSTFTCQIDNKAPVPCQSGQKFKVRKKGKHSISIVASIFGLTETTPEVDRWKRTNKKR